MLFVVFENGRKQINNVAEIEVGGAGNIVDSGRIKLPDGSSVDLPTSRRIFEDTSGKFSSVPITFTRTQLRAYLKSDPSPPTIEGLQHFLSEH